jgi:hypothetical protein
MLKDAPDEASIRYGKLLTRLTGQRKAREMAIIRASCAWRDPATTARVLPFRGKKGGPPAPALRLSLPTALGGRTLRGLCAAFGPPVGMGWQKHTVRGFMAGAMKKAGHAVESFKPEGGERTYRLCGAPHKR